MGEALCIGDRIITFTRDSGSASRDDPLIEMFRSFRKRIVLTGSLGRLQTDSNTTSFFENEEIGNSYL